MRAGHRMHLYWSEDRIPGLAGLTARERRIRRIRARANAPALARWGLALRLALMAAMLGAGWWVLAVDPGPRPLWVLAAWWGMVAVLSLSVSIIEASLLAASMDRLREAEARGIGPPTEAEIEGAWPSPDPAPTPWTAALGLWPIPELRGLCGLGRELLLLRADEAMPERWFASIGLYALLPVFAFEVWAVATSQTYLLSLDGGPPSEYHFHAAAAVTGLTTMAVAYTRTWLVRRGIQKVLAARDSTG